MIPTYLEQLIHQGRARYDSRSYSLAQNWQLIVNDEEYIVIYEFYYTPYFNAAFLENDSESPLLQYDGQDSSQCVSFFTGNGYHPFLFKQTPGIANFAPRGEALADRFIPPRVAEKRECYIISDQNVNVAITRQGLTLSTLIEIPVTPSFGTSVATLGYAGAPSIYEIEAPNGTAISALPYGQPQTGQYFPPLLSPQGYDQIFWATPAGAVPAANMQLLDDQAYKGAAAYMLTINFVRVRGLIPNKIQP